MPSLHYTPVDKKANSLLQRDCMTNTLITVVVKGSRNPKLLVVHEEKETHCSVIISFQLIT